MTYVVLENKNEPIFIPPSYIYIENRQLKEVNSTKNRCRTRRYSIRVLKK
jgi:hypothetical protein